MIHFWNPQLTKLMIRRQLQHWPPPNFSAQLALNLVPEPNAKTVLNGKQKVSKLPGDCRHCAQRPSTGSAASSGGSPGGLPGGDPGGLVAITGQQRGKSRVAGEQRERVERPDGKQTD